MAEREGLQQLCQAKRSSRVWREKRNKMPSSSRGRDKKTKEKNEHTHSETQMGGRRTVRKEEEETKSGRTKTSGDTESVGGRETGASHQERMG